MATSSLTVSGSKTSIAGGSGGTRPVGPFTWPNNTLASDNFSTQTLTAATFAAVVVPANSVGVIIYPPSGNVGTITLKGVTGDTGVNLHKINPTPLTLDIAGASFGLLCSATTVIEFEWL